MKFLTVTAALFASSSLAVPTNPNTSGACAPNGGSSSGDNTSWGHGGNPTGGNTSWGHGGNPTGGNTSNGGNPTNSGSSTGSNPTDSGSSTGPATTGTGSSTGPATTGTGSNTGPATTGTGSSTGPATTDTGSSTGSDTSTGSNTSTGPATTSTGGPGGEFHCPAGLYSNLQCCSVDVLGVLDLDCANPSRTPISGNDFKSICAAVGKQAKCCVLPVAGQDVLCQDAIPGGPTSTGPGGNPTSSGPGGNPTSTGPGGNPTSSGPGGNPTSSGPGGNPTSSNPGGNPTSSGPGGNPTNPPGEFHCPAGLYSNAQCCSTDVLGVLGLDCNSPSRTPTSGDDFKAICAASGKQAKCCVLPIAGQDVLCQDAIGGGNPTSSNPGGNPTSSGPGSNPTSSGPGSNPTSSGPGSNPTSSGPGGNPTSSGPGSNPTNPAGEFKCPSGLYSNPECCSTDVLGVLGLDCESPSKTPTSGDDFKAICAAKGKQAKCCVLPVAGQGVLCQDAIGGGNPSSSGGNPTSSGPGSNPTSSGPGSNPTSSGPGSNPTSSNPGGNPTSSAPGSNPTNPPGHFKCPSGLYSNLQCCSTDVLGVLGLDCNDPSKAPTSGNDFKSICAAEGKQAKCCVLPIAGQSVLCEDAIGGGNPPSSGGNPTGSQPGGGNPTSSAPGSNPTSSQPGSNPTSTQPAGGSPTTSQPAGSDNGPVCPKGLYSTPQCCSTDVLGVADLDCSTPSKASGPKAFKASCAAKGKQAKCCVLPVAGQSLLCQDAIN